MTVETPPLAVEIDRLTALNKELLAALKRAVPWLGRLIADGGHLACVLPNDAVGALQQAEAVIAKAEKRTT